MSDAEEKRSGVDVWRMLQILSPLVSIVVFIVYMRAEVSQTINDVELLKENGENVGEILTAHTTQLAVNATDIANIRINQTRVENALIRIEGKLDRLVEQKY
jgi:hypothetical protein